MESSGELFHWTEWSSEMRQILATLLLLHYLVILTIISGLIYIENISFPSAKHLKTKSLSSLSTSEAKVVDIFLTRYFNNHATDTNNSYGLDWWIFFMSLGTKLQYKKFKFE